eukprot:8908647-Lingulodinium_polyedra.AAC.1
MESCVFLRNENEPRKAIQCSWKFTDFATDSMAKYLRPNQANDVYQFVNNQGIAHRPGIPLAKDPSNRLKFPTMAMVTNLAEQEQERRRLNSI